ncbi:hypothetical protein [Nesterenkonia sp. DZ6]|uniref:hypothetical protein n=1 Tax=Nesterenkonia sp. DZ6 TaxID=2901229 RepID=UPI001F4CBEAA|nr:hypothetical protein [Nesterenkonia sp. DZ6]MCH8559201.1 hypothetical protein [Nesterenkonia sp. DZ6]
MEISRVSIVWVEILSVEEGLETGFAEGAGYRVLADGKAGLLVGGPFIEVRDARKTCLLSAHDSGAVAEEIRRRLVTAS